ncbi:hypothetical protein K3718_10825 [Leisingera aquaemixtae]|uniref:Uncharacterized protein n=1 Tax=Leisingera aquaemixtae TaxID=1396826 RepID=A0ABY5WF25_9RHOB|nr:hypothetical protein [Leisingera aquaemixtae]UWQ40066.1 hypothetical protein K3718_10825 [Leisingera aquaemixtae]
MKANVNAVLCGSIHQEDNGKFILVGVLAGELITTNDSFDEDFDLFISINNFNKQEAILELELVYPEGPQGASKLPIQNSDLSYNTTVQVSGIPLKTKKSGNFEINWRWEGEKKWKNLIGISVTISANPERISDLKTD